MSEKFDILNLKPELLINLRELGFSSMTPIQSKSLPLVLDGGDVIAQAKTGSGKTAAFGLGILNSLEIEKLKIQSMILCPTRELAEQVALELRKLARMSKNVKILTLCGGVSDSHQEVSLSHGVHIVVGTPGRVLSLLKKKILNTVNIKTFVLDEADRMLDMGFHDDIMAIAGHVPRRRQSLLFSATFPDKISEMAQHILVEPTEVKVDTEHSEDSITQSFYELKRHRDKGRALLKILARHKPDRFIVFCMTKQTTNEIARLLDQNGISAESINGDLEQNERVAVLTKFSNRSISALVATDVAARGLDISELAAVVNYDLPNDPEIYVHRVGRTGRAGLTGMAFSLYVDRNSQKLDAIEELTGTICDIVEVPELNDGERYDLDPPMKTMFISGGKKDKLRPGDILGALVGEAKLDAKDVGDINILNVLSYVAIKSDKIDQAIQKIQNGKIKKRKFRVGLA